jgi:hypothetical protein
MIRQRLIASLVGGILIFVLQFLSWTVLKVHAGAEKYTAQQNQVLSTISSAITEEGTYLMPTSPPNASREEMEKVVNDAEGKPMAMVTFVKSYHNDMTMSMIRGLLVNIFLVYLFIYIMTRAGNPEIVRWIAGAFSIGMFTWLYDSYTMHIWFQTPWASITGALIEALLAWTLCGLWVGWYYNRNSRAANNV